MKICGIEILHADGGWRTLSFLKVLTDDRLVGWSEFHESFAAGRVVVHYDYGDPDKSLDLWPVLGGAYLYCWGATGVDGGGSGHDRSLAFGCRSL